MLSPLSSQIDHARRSVLLVRASELEVIVVRGSDRISWLNGLLTCNLAAAAPGQAIYGLAVQQKGRIVCDVTVLVEEDRVLLVVPASIRAELETSFDHYLVMEDAEFSHVPYAVWHAHGPRARDLVAAARGASGASAAEIDPTGLGGAILAAPSEDEAKAFEALSTAVQQAGGLVGDDAGWEALRIEQGVPRFSRDFDGTTYPQEATLERRAVSFDKGCYLGQEVVCMLEMRGRVKRKLAPLVLANDGAPEPPAKGTEVFDAAGNKVGEITSSAPSPTRDAHVAFAMLKASAVAPDAAVKVAGRDARIYSGSAEK
ncbi:folate-binding protein YgfZ [Pendulispora rubella]|uniref:Folate-binding protein YgfZ n=2 Tax=Pendulispora rubella TaxID=2741070 RepID=A0ABZ2KWE7_9BACT